MCCDQNVDGLTKLYGYRRILTQMDIAGWPLSLERFCTEFRIGLSNGSHCSPEHYNKRDPHQNRFLVWSPPLKFMSSYAIGTVARDYSARGFRVTDDLGDVPISSVKIVAATVVDLELSEETSGSVLFVWYGQKLHLEVAEICLIAMEQYLYQITNIALTLERSSANITALVNKPYPLNNPCVAFYRQATSL